MAYKKLQGFFTTSENKKQKTLAKWKVRVVKPPQRKPIRCKLTSVIGKEISLESFMNKLAEKLISDRRSEAEGTMKCMPTCRNVLPPVLEDAGIENNAPNSHIYVRVIQI